MKERSSWLLVILAILLAFIMVQLVLFVIATESASEPRVQWETWPKQWGSVTVWGEGAGKVEWRVWGWATDRGLYQLGRYEDLVLADPAGATTKTAWSHNSACGVSGSLRLNAYPWWGEGWAFGCAATTPQPPAPTRTPRPPTPTPKPGEPTRTPVPPQPTSTPGPQPTATPPVGGEPSASTNVPLVLRYMICEGNDCRRVRNDEVDFQVTSAILSPDAWEVWLKSTEDFSMDLNPEGEVPLLFNPQNMGEIEVRWDGSWTWSALACMLQPAQSTAWSLAFWPDEEQFLLVDMLKKHGWSGRQALCQLVTIDSLDQITRVVKFRSRPAQ